MPIICGNFEIILFTIFALRKVWQFSSQTKHKIEYPNISCDIRPVPHDSLSLPVPKLSGKYKPAPFDISGREQRSYA